MHLSFTVLLLFKLFDTSQGLLLPHRRHEADRLRASSALEVKPKEALQARHVEITFDIETRCHAQPGRVLRARCLLSMAARQGAFRRTLS